MAGGFISALLDRLNINAQALGHQQQGVDLQPQIVVSKIIARAFRVLWDEWVVHQPLVALPGRKRVIVLVQIVRKVRSLRRVLQVGLLVSLLVSLYAPGHLLIGHPFCIQRGNALAAHSPANQVGQITLGRTKRQKTVLDGGLNHHIGQHAGASEHHPVTRHHDRAVRAELRLL